MWAATGVAHCPFCTWQGVFHLSSFGSRAHNVSLCVCLGYLPLPGSFIRLSPPWTNSDVCISCTHECFRGRCKWFLELMGDVRTISQGIFLSCTRSKQHCDDLSSFYLPPTFEECSVTYASLCSHLLLLLPVMYSIQYPKKLLFGYFPPRLILLLTDIDSDGHPYVKARTTGLTSTYKNYLYFCY